MSSSSVTIQTLASTNQTSDATETTDAKIIIDTWHSLPISTFDSHSTFVHLNLTPMESDGIRTNLFIEEPLKRYHNDIQVWTKQKSWSSRLCLEIWLMEAKTKFGT